MKQLIGIFGGTFDPVHLGHLNAIDLLSESFEFEQIHWVLSARPPHKSQTTATIEHRFAMLEQALADRSNYIADDTEITRLATSYTFDTIAEFRIRYPNAQLYLIIGGDSLNNLASWHRYEELLDQVNCVVLHRPGYEMQIPDQFENRFVDQLSALTESSAGKMYLFEHSHFNISSSQLRLELNTVGVDSKLVQENLLASVIDYIQTHQLYRIRSMNPEQIKDQVVDALESIKGNDVRVIDINDISDFADYMVVVSGTSDTHVKALAREASDSLRKQGVKPLNEDGADVGEWVLVDFGDVVLHVMRPEVREYYDLEKLWDEDVRALINRHREEQED